MNCVLPILFSSEIERWLLMISNSLAREINIFQLMLSVLLDYFDLLSAHTQLHLYLNLFLIINAKIHRIVPTNDKATNLWISY